MKAMLLNDVYNISENKAPLALMDLPTPQPGPNEILIRVSACGICHTELDEIEGRTPPPRFPIIPGHQAVGHVVAQGEHAKRFKSGNRVGVAWIFSACGRCRFCKDGNENLCPEFKATGRDADGGYAEYMTVPETFAYPIPDAFSDILAAPLLCAGAIGYRSLRLCSLKDGQHLGLTGFGASAHLVLKMFKHQYPNSDAFVFARSKKEQDFSRELGAAWAGDTDGTAPVKLDAIIDTTPVWKPVVEALKNLENGGRLVVNAIRKESIDKDYLLRLDYPVHLWMEKEIKSVANVTAEDVSQFIRLADEIGIRPEVEVYDLKEANQALAELKAGNIRGAKVLKID